MKYVTLLIITACSLNFFSQDQVKNKRISITPFAQYGMSHRTLKGNYTISESPLNTFGYGLRLSYNLKKIALSTGIEYQQYGEQSKFSNLIFGSQIDANSGFINSNDPALPSSIIYKYKYNYLAVPLIVSYSFSFKMGTKFKLNYSLFAGAKANIFYSAITKTISEYENKENTTSKSNRTFDNRNLCMSSVYGILFHKKLGSKLNLKIGPTVDLFHQSVANSSPIERVPYKGSIFVGLTF